MNTNDIYSLVFRRKDLCEAKHDLGVRKNVLKNYALLSLHYAVGGGIKHSVLNMNAIEWEQSVVNMNAIVRAKRSKHECYRVRAKCSKHECYSESKA